MSFAVVNYVRLEDSAAAAASTREVVVPRLRQLPGFEQAIFLADDATGRGFSVMVFAAREQADEMATRVGNGDVPAPPGIAFDRQEVHEVVATT
jgi:hypothetical protein